MGNRAADADGPRFAGFVDDFASGHLQGWAVDRSGPDHDACVVVFAGDLLVGACRADAFRPDLVALMPGEGRHGFACFLSEEVFDAGGIEVLAVARDVFDALVRADATGDDGRLLGSRRDFDRAFEGSFGGIEGWNEASPALRDLRAGPDGGSARGGAGGPGLILVEVGDLLAYHRVHARVSGIQRVLCGLIDGLSAARGAAGLGFCILGERPGSVRVVDEALLRGFVSTVLGGEATRDDLDALIQALESGARAHETRAADTVFIAGAFWIYDRLDRHLARMRDRGTRVGLLLYDLIPLTHPRWVSDATRRLFGECAVQALPQFDVLFTTSRFVAGQARSILSNEVGLAPPIRTVALPHRSMAGAGAARPVPSHPAAEEPFVLCVGTVEVRKNHMLLYRVWAALLRKHGRAAVPRLVLVGRWGWDVEEFRQALDATDGLDGLVAVLPDASDGALADLYRRCLFTVFPSFAEGWGLPVGESLAAGKLCVASRATAIPEVGGDACAYFDPHDELDAFAAIERPIVDPAWLAARERQIGATFRPRTWAETSADVLRGLGAARAEPDGGRGRGPVFGVGDVVDLTARSRDDDRAPWRTRMAGAVLGAGWHPPGAGGVSASARTSVIVFRTDRTPGTAVTVLLRVAGTGRERPCRLRVAGGREIAHLTVAGRRPRWHEVEAAVEPGGVLRLTISGPAGRLPASRDQGTGFALLRLAVCGEDAESRAETYRRLLDAPPDAEIPREESGAAV